MPFVKEKRMPNDIWLPYFTRHTRVRDTAGRPCCEKAEELNIQCSKCGNTDTILVENEWIERKRKYGRNAGVWFEYRLNRNPIDLPKPELPALTRFQRLLVYLLDKWPEGSQS